MNVGLYFRNIATFASQLLNTILGGSPGETLSSRTGKLADRHGWKQLAWLLDKIDPDHVTKVRQDDEGDRNTGIPVVLALGIAVMVGLVVYEFWLK